MSIKLDRDLLWVVCEEGRMFVHTPDGKRIVGEIFCRVTDENNQLPKVILKAIVNIAGSVEEMNEKIRISNLTAWMVERSADV